MEMDYFEKYIIEQMRLQRHDFMNYLQIIYGYIQINKPQEAIGYIKNINRYMIAAGKVFNLECDEFGIIFQEFVNKCITHRIQLELNIGIEYISCENFSKDIDRKKKLFCTTTDILLDRINFFKDFGQRLYIYFEGLPGDFSIIICNEELSKPLNYFNSTGLEPYYEAFEGDNKAVMFCGSEGNIGLKMSFK